MLRLLRVRIARAAAGALLLSGVSLALPAPAAADHWHHRPSFHAAFWLPLPPPPPFFLPPPPRVVVHRHDAYCGHRYDRPHRRWHHDRYYDHRYERRHRHHHDDDWD